MVKVCASRKVSGVIVIMAGLSFGRLCLKSRHGESAASADGGFTPPSDIGMRQCRPPWSICAKVNANFRQVLWDFGGGAYRNGKGVRLPDHGGEAAIGACGQISKAAAWVGYGHGRDMAVHRHKASFIGTGWCWSWRFLGYGVQPVRSISLA